MMLRLLTVQTRCAFKRTDLIYRLHNRKRVRFISTEVITNRIQTAQAADVFKTKLNDLVKWYEELTGMDEVRLAQKRVLQAEEKFMKSQETRRDLNILVAEIQNKLKDLHLELDSTTRGEERYVSLITQEHQVLKEERLVKEKFLLAERAERENFTALSSSVKDSHEKERAQAERTKYWSIIGSIVGTVLGIVGTSINNRRRMTELRELVKDSNNIEVLNELSRALADQKQRIEGYLEAGQTSEGSRGLKEDQNTESHKLLSSLNQILDNFENKLMKQKSFEAQPLLYSSNVDSELVVVAGNQLLEQIEQQIEQQNRTIRVLVVTAVVGLLVSITAKFF